MNVSAKAFRSMSELQVVSSMSVSTAPRGPSRAIACPAARAEEKNIVGGMKKKSASPCGVACSGHVDRMSRLPDEVVLALGVLSTPQQRARRDLIRNTYGANPSIVADVGPLRLRFVLAANHTLPQALRAEQQQHADLHLIRMDERIFYATKVFRWLKACAKQRPAFCAIADDDAFLETDRILVDLRAIKARGEARVVYGSFNWFAYHRDTGQFDCWGSQLSAPGGSVHAWRARTGISRSVWPGNSRLRRSRTPTCNHSRNEGLLALWRRRSPFAKSLTLPFPMAKGAFTAWSLAVASYLAESEHSAREQAHALQVVTMRMGRAIPNAGQVNYNDNYRKILHDVFVSHVLASANGGRGLEKVALFSLRHGHERERVAAVEACNSRACDLSAPRLGYLEYRGYGHEGDGGGMELSRMPSVVSGSTRVIHFGARQLFLATRPRRNGTFLRTDRLGASAHALWQSRALEHLRSRFALAHRMLDRRVRPSGSRDENEHSRAALGPPAVSCSQPDWWSRSRCVVAVGQDWRVCHLGEGSP